MSTLSLGMIENSVIQGAQSDQALISRAASGEQEAFDLILQRYKAKILGYICRMAPTRADAEDLTQEVFVRAYLSLPGLRRVRNLSTWLFKVASNICIDEYRRRDRSVQRMSFDETAQGPEGPRAFEFADLGETPEQAVLNEELRLKLESAVSKLPVKLKSVILLFDVQGMSYEEIAQIESCPIGTVKSRLFNARSALRKALGPYLGREMATEGA